MINGLLDFFQNTLINLSKIWNFLTTEITIPFTSGLGGEALTISPLMLFSTSALFIVLTIVIVRGLIS